MGGMDAPDRPARRGLFGRGASRGPSASEPDDGAGRPGFDYLSGDAVYLDSACQTPRPQPVIDAVQDYYLHTGACGGRVKYDAGRRVDAQVQAARERALAAVGVSPRRYSCAFTLNTTYGLGLLLSSLPQGRFARIVTTVTEHNAVFLSTIAAARRAGIPRIVLERGDDGSILADGDEWRDAVVVVSAMDNVIGMVTPGLRDLIAAVHRAGGIVIVDAAQAAAHALEALRGLDADAICFSAHKMYGPSLGAVIATNELLLSLDPVIVGGGQVSAVSRDDFTLLPEPHSRLEPGLQAWAEIIGFGAALEWLGGFRSVHGETLAVHEHRLATRLYEGLAALPHLQLIGPAPTPVISVLPERIDGHRLATFLARAGISVRSGSFCAHHWLIERRGLGPLVRFSIGAHNTDADIDRTLARMAPMMAGL